MLITVTIYEVPFIGQIIECRYYLHLDIHLIKIILHNTNY